MAVVGPGSLNQEEVAPPPTLAGASEYEYVAVFNPLSDDFAIQVAQTRPVDVPYDFHKSDPNRGVTSSENDAAQLYGLALRNPDHRGQKHILNQTIIKAGATMNFRGDVAQVAVRQLTNEIIQREGKTLRTADPVTRHEVEERIIKGRGLIEDLMDGGIKPVQTVMDEAINNSNLSSGDTTNERAFPGLQVGGEEKSAGAGDLPPIDDKEVVKRGPGRPKKTDTVG